MISRRRRLSEIMALRERRLARLLGLLAAARARLDAATEAVREAERTLQGFERAIAALAGALSSGAVDCDLMESCLARSDQLARARAAAVEALADARRAERAAQEDVRQATSAWARARARLEAVTRWRAREMAADAAGRERRAAADAPSGHAGGALWS